MALSQKRPVHHGRPLRPDVVPAIPGPPTGGAVESADEEMEACAGDQRNK